MNKLGPIRNTRRVVQRNEPCPFCTSGLKFKRCHGKPQDGKALGPIPAERKVLK